MDLPLTVTSIVLHAERVNGGGEIVSVTADNPRHRYTYREAFARVRRLASSMVRWGLAPGDRVGTLAWTENPLPDGMAAVTLAAADDALVIGAWAPDQPNPRLLLLRDRNLTEVEVDGTNLMPMAKLAVHQMASNKSACASDQDSHA